MLSSEESPHESHTGAMRLAKAALVPAVIILASDGILLNAYGLDDDETEAYARRFLRSKAEAAVPGEERGLEKFVGFIKGTLRNPMAFKSSYQRLNKVLLERRVYDQGLATTKFETELTNLEDAFKKRGPNAEFFDTEEFWLLFHNLGVVNSRLADTHRVQLKELLLKRFDQKVLDDIGGMAIKSTDPLMHGFGKAVISKEKRESIDVEAARIRATEET